VWTLGAMSLWCYVVDNCEHKQALCKSLSLFLKNKGFYRVEIGKTHRIRKEACGTLATLLFDNLNVFLKVKQHSIYLPDIMTSEETNEMQGKQWCSTKPIQCIAVSYCASYNLETAELKHAIKSNFQLRPLAFVIDTCAFTLPQFERSLRGLGFCQLCFDYGVCSEMISLRTKKWMKKQCIYFRQQVTNMLMPPLRTFHAIRGGAPSV